MEFWNITVGNLDFHRWKSRFPKTQFFGFDYEIDRIKIGFPLPPPGDLNERGFLKLLYEAVHAGDTHAHVLGEPILAGKAKVIVPGVAEQQRVDRLGTDRNVGIAEDEVWMSISAEI